MQNNKFRNYLQMLSVSLVAAFVITGCTKEDLSQCIEKPDNTYKLLVKAYDADGVELTTENVKDVALYIFDRDNKFIAIRSEAKLGQSIVLDYPNNDILKVVAWGNGSQGHQAMPTLSVGDKMETAFVSLLNTKATMATIQSPDDLFHGSITLKPENREMKNTLPIYRKTSGVTITANKLKQHVNASDDDFTYVLRSTGNKINFEGKEAGELSNYIPKASFTENKDEFIAPLFNILTTASNIEVDIFYGTTKVATVVSAANGEPLRVEAGKVLNILIEFTGDTSADITVKVEVTPWGVEYIWKEFPNPWGE